MQTGTQQLPEVTADSKFYTVAEATCINRMCRQTIYRACRLTPQGGATYIWLHTELAPDLDLGSRDRAFWAHWCDSETMVAAATPDPDTVVCYREPRLMRGQ